MCVMARLSPKGTDVGPLTLHCAARWLGSCWSVEVVEVTRAVWHRCRCVDELEFVEFASRGSSVVECGGCSGWERRAAAGVRAARSVDQRGRGG